MNQSVGLHFILMLTLDIMLTTRKLVPVWRRCLFRAFKGNATMH